METLSIPRKIEDESKHADTAQLAAYLQSHLGAALCAYLAGARDRKAPGHWSRGRVPRDEVTIDRLRYGYQAARLLLAAYDDDTARAWFIGANELLGDEAPASVLREGQTPEDWRLVIPAAKDFTQTAFAPQG